MPETRDLYEEACACIPGGVNSPVRAFRAVGGFPIFIRSAGGAYLHDHQGRSYIDYVGAWGPMILGHAHPAVLEKLRGQLGRGLAYGAPTELETEFARKLCELVPSLEQVRLVNSGTEAAMSAVRLARGYTGRDLIIKFDGCYHGHTDALLVKAGSGALSMGAPDSAGVPAALAELTLCLPYNDTHAVEQACAAHGARLAAILVEPVAGNMGLVPPQPGFLEKLRGLCDATGSLLIFDEVMSGFRVALGGAQTRYNVTPDLCLLGKVIGGGLPVGAFGGRAEIMQLLAPDGPVYQAGTLSGNPLAVSAGLVTLELLQQPGCYETLERYGAALTQGLAEAAEEAALPWATAHVGGMFGYFPGLEGPVTHFKQVAACDHDLFRCFFHGMLKRGVYLAPSPFEAGFISLAHGDEELQQSLEAARTVLRELSRAPRAGKTP